MALLMAQIPMLAQSTSTLRLDYIFSGTDKSTEISLSELKRFDTWAGRRHNLDKTVLRGNGQISLRRLSDSVVVYRNSFSTLFQEWQATEEATRVRKSFENVFLVPMPSEKVLVRIELYGFKGEITAEMEHVVDPEDILIRSLPVKSRFSYIHKGGSAQECIDVAIVAEGYTAGEMDIFRSDARQTVDAILAHEPFRSMKDKFNFIAVECESAQSGVSIPANADWKDTALGASFSTFYSDRYLTTLHLGDLHDILAGLPYEHIIILANTDNYGGGGIFNSYTLTTAHHPLFRPVVVHEFGHSFAGLGDEYYYDDQFAEMYYPQAEPWEPNITTMKDFSSKWQNLLYEDTPVPTPAVDAASMWKEISCGKNANDFLGVYEGGGYQSKGVFRPFPDCRMKTNEAPMFCPACQQAIKKLIEFYL